jgi:hypothetical protein
MEQTVKQPDWATKAKLFMIELASVLSLFILLVWWLWTELKHLFGAIIQ